MCVFVIHAHAFAGLFVWNSIRTRSFYVNNIISCSSVSAHFCRRLFKIRSDHLEMWQLQTGILFYVKCDIYFNKWQTRSYECVRLPVCFLKPWKIYNFSAKFEAFYKTWIILDYNDFFVWQNLRTQNENCIRLTISSFRLWKYMVD